MSLESSRALVRKNTSLPVSEASRNAVSSLPVPELTSATQPPEVLE
jgi:hypothetical protein